MYGSNPFFDADANGVLSVNLENSRLFVNGDEATEVEPFSGCQGANGYRKYFVDLGFVYCIPLDNSSSAGNWSFAVSKDGENWVIGGQENNFPVAGFTYWLDDETGVDILNTEEN